MKRLATALAAVLALGACSSGGHHDDPMLIPAGSTGVAALGQPMADLDRVVSWVQKVTDECDDASPATSEQLAEYLGPQRFEWYSEYVAQWATCKVAPYDKIGLVVFEPQAQKALQEAWIAALKAGEERSDPDWAFGNGFAVTAGALGVEEMGLRYLMCEKGEIPGAEVVASDVEGCVFAAFDHHEGA
jgi:hypothetical protein